jgi:hypothetical protein
MIQTDLRFTTRQLLLLVAVTALGLGLAPTGAGYLAAFCPGAVAARHLSPGLSSFFGGLGVVLFAFAEILLGMPVSACLYLAGALALAPPWELVSARPEEGTSTNRVSRACTRRCFAYLAVYACVAALHLIPWTSRKPFLQALSSIHRGMTVAEVKRRMAGYQEGTGWIDPFTNQEIKINGSLVFRHSDEARFNADWGIVSFQEGRVVEVRFEPD